MTLEEWVEKYEARCEEYVLLPGFECYFEPERGFMCWGIEQHGEDKYFIIDHTCTNDMDAYHKIAHDLAIENNCKYMTTQTIRSPKAYVRKSGGAHLDLKLSGFRPNGKWYWVFVKETANDKI